MSRSASSSPSRKKLRLSSPTYDDHFDELDGFDFRILDEIETSFSCGDVGTPPKSPTRAPDRGAKRRRAIEDALKAVQFDHHDDSGIAFVGSQDRSENIPPKSPTSHPRPSISRAPTFTSSAPLPLVAEAPKGDTVPNPSSAAFLPVSMLVSADKLNYSSQSLKEPSEHDHDALFAPYNTTTASAHTHTSVSSLHDPRFKTSESAMDLELQGIGAVSMDNMLQRSKSSWAFPSADALDRAKKKHQIWQAEIETEIETELSAVEGGQDIESGKQIDNKQPVINRKPLKGVENSVSLTSEITRASSASLTALDPRSTSVPVGPFKAPPLTPSRSYNDIPPSSHHFGAPFASVVSRSSAAAGLAFSGTPLASSVRLPLATPIKQDSLHARSEAQTPMPFPLPRPIGSSQHQLVTPQKARPLGLSPRARAFTSSRARPKFVTPFKQGKRPDDRNVMHSSQPNTNIQLRSEVVGNGHEVVPSSVEKAQAYIKPSNRGVAPSVHSNRNTLANSKLVPRIYDSNKLNETGLDANILSLPTILHFLKYRFNLTGSDPFSTQKSLGSDSALETLLATGCHLATKAWVDNHWSFILWKIFGMTYLEPSKVDKKWCWDEVMRQLRYRYQRELADGSRPALRLIVAQDAPSSGPLVLCISNIFWTDECVDAKGRKTPAHPELEVTDGWYRLRATVDDVLARAARKGRLRIGRKIACSGARLDSSRKVPMEVLDAYGSTHLVLSGNSTHLAPWHAKLGFQSAPFIATLRSLTADGGFVPLADLMITQVHPVGYIEFVTTDQGATIREGPRTKEDEALEEDRWNVRRSHEAAKLRDKLEKKWQELESYADRLERIAGSQFHPTEDDSPPDRVEDLVDVLADSEDPASVIRQVDKADAGWLSLLLRKKCEADREKSGDEIDRELASSFPPRQVRNFRILHVRDAQSVRKPSWRTAQLMVWDVMSLNVAEGGSPGAFHVGQRYLVSSLVPTHQSAWMGLEPGSEIHLNTRLDSKWKLIK